MSNPKPDVNEVGARMKALIDYVRDCERRVGQGEVVDMNGLDRNVLQVCEALSALPRSEARDLENKMLTLVERLGALAESMKAQQDKLKAQA